MRKDHIEQKRFAVAMGLLQALEIPLDVSRYLMEKDRQERVLVVLVTVAEAFDLKRLMLEQKRSGDLLFDILPKENLYALLCRDTDIEGGFQMIKRLKRHLDLSHIESFIVEIEVRKSYAGGSRDIIYRLFELFVNACETERKEIFFYSLH